MIVNIGIWLEATNRGRIEAPFCKRPIPSKTLLRF